MADDILEGITKEVEEVEYKGIDLRNWLEEGEDVVSRDVEAYEVYPRTIKEFNSEDIKYIDITTYDADNNVINEESRWEMSDDFTRAIFQIERPSQSADVTEDIIVSEGTGSSDSSYWVQRIDYGRYRVGIKNGEINTTYRVSVTFETEANRTKIVHFPVEIIDATM